MTCLISQAAHFSHRRNIYSPPLPLHSGPVLGCVDQRSSWGRAADEHFRRRGRPGVVWVAAGRVYTAEGGSGGEGKPGLCVTAPPQGGGRACPRGSRWPSQYSDPAHPAALARAHVIPVHLTSP